jgi:hypothetical protein
VGDVTSTIYRWYAQHIGKIRPSVPRPTGTAIGQTKDVSFLSSPQPLGTFHSHAADDAFTEHLLDLSGNSLNPDDLLDYLLGGRTTGNDIHDRSNYL